MQGDTIIVEERHRRAAAAIAPLILPDIRSRSGRYTITVAGESGSGKSETATAIAEVLAQSDVGCVILQQDDYFVYPPKTNDRARRKDIQWVGPQEVRLDLMDQHLEAFRSGRNRIEKPLVIYEDDRITGEVLDTGKARVAIAEGTYTSLLHAVDTRVFIDRSYADTRAHREKRSRDAAELDPFIDRVLEIEHGIISAHKARADIVINKDYTVSPVNG